MTISVFGLGYVGCVTAACLAQDGYSVIGVDVSQHKVRLLSQGKSPLLEPGLDDRIASAVRSRLLRVCSDAESAVQGSDVSLICVGTPSNGNGSLDLRYVKNVCAQIGAALSRKQRRHLVVIRSTVLPGTVEGELIPLLEQTSGLRAGADFGVCMNPEFLREGTALEDYHHPSFVVIGAIDSYSAAGLQKLFASVQAPVFHTTIKHAEMIKYACNTFHALKVTFANEIGQICKQLDLDAQEVMEIFVQDRQLNVSPAYLRPAFAFGGACLPKDVRALVYRARELDAECPVINAILPSNRHHVELAIRRVEQVGRRKVGILGLSFKPDTDDLRESPTIAMAETLIGRGYSVAIFDDQVQLGNLIGANKTYVERELPHIGSLLCRTLEELVAASEVVVLAHAGKAFNRVSELMTPEQVLVDLVGTAKGSPSLRAAYDGLSW